MTVPIFQTFVSTVTPFVRGRPVASWHILQHPYTGAPTGLQSTSGNGAQGIFAPLDMTADQIANPSVLMLEDLNSTFRLDEAPYTRYVSNGTALVPAGGTGSGSVTAVSVTSANGFAGSVATPNSTPTLTLSTTITGILQGDGTAISAATTTGTGAIVLESAISGFGTGNVSNAGTPVSGQLARWTASTIVEGVDFVTALAAADLSSLPTSDPGGGKPWLNGGFLFVGAI